MSEEIPSDQPPQESKSERPSDPIVETQSERIIIDGLPLDSKNAIEMERFMKVTSGRRKIPLPLMFRVGGTDMATSSGQDIYVAVACYDTTTVGSEKVLKISNLLFSGSFEALVHVSDSDGPLKVESFKHCCLLILNPSVIGSSSLRVPSLKACLKLGNLTGLEKCEKENCDKPVLTDRDGSLCYKHSSQMTMRVQVGGSSLTFEEGSKEEEAKIKSRKLSTSLTLSAEERKAQADEKRRQDLLAKKKTAMLLLNRSNGANTHATMRLSTGDDRSFDIGEMSEGPDSQAKVARYQALKRKRETLSRFDEIKQRKETRKKEVLENFPVVLELVDKGPRKSISEQLAKVIKSERGF